MLSHHTDGAVECAIVISAKLGYHKAVVPVGLSREHNVVLAIKCKAVGASASSIASEAFHCYGGEGDFGIIFVKHNVNGVFITVDGKIVLVAISVFP